MQNLILDWAMNHQQWIEGFILGAVLSNPGTCATLIFNAFVKLPGVGQWIAANPEKAKSWFDGFDKAIDAAVNKYAKDNAPKTPAQGDQNAGK